jgi:ABC-type phosphate/phosphonate transport system, ATPase component
VETLYVVKDGKIVQFDGQTKESNVLNEAAVIELYGNKAIEDINRYGAYNIRKKYHEP